MEVEHILNEKIKWISQKQKQTRNEKSEIVKQSFNNDSTLPQLGKNYPLEINYNEERKEEKIEFHNNKFVVYLDLDSKENESKEKIKSIYAIVEDTYSNRFSNQFRNF